MIADTKQIFLILYMVSCIRTSVNENKVVFYAFSGLRWDSDKLVEMQSIQEMKRKGVSVKRKTDKFQTESLPSFITMSSGKYPSEHGMVSNRMQNKIGQIFDVSKTSSKWWNGFEPIWITNQRVRNATSALCYWPGFDVVFTGRKVSKACNVNKVDPFKQLLIKNEIINKAKTFKKRNLQVKQWLKTNQTGKQPSFIGVYFEEPYLSMAKYGVHSKQTKKALKHIDTIIGDMLRWITKEKLNKVVNFIVAGESGVTDLFEKHEIFLDEKAKKYQYKIIDNGPITTIQPKDNKTMHDLLKIWKGNAYFDVYSKDEIPESFRFKHSTRTSPITLVAKQHWRIYKDVEQLKSADGKKGMMGYDGKYESTHALFVAQGPSFKENEEFPAIGNVEVYDILCRALNISKVSNSSVVNEMMRQEEKWFEQIIHKVVNKITESPKYFVLAIVVTALLFFAAVFLIVSAIYKAIGCFKCKKNPLKVKVPSPRKLFNRKTTKESGEHLLSDRELSDSDMSSDEFYYDRNSKK